MKSPDPQPVYQRRIQFYETDGMGIVHHGNYIYFMEEARTELFRSIGMFDELSLDKINYPVLDLQIQYKNPIHFNDVVDISIAVSFDQARLIFDYEMKTKRFSQPVAFGKTIHIAVEMPGRKPIRIPAKILGHFKK